MAREVQINCLITMRVPQSFFFFFTGRYTDANVFCILLTALLFLNAVSLSSFMYQLSFLRLISTFWSSRYFWWICRILLTPKDLNFTLSKRYRLSVQGLLCESDGRLQLSGYWELLRGWLRDDIFEQHGRRSSGYEWVWNNLLSWGKKGEKWGILRTTPSACSVAKEIDS